MPSAKPAALSGLLVSKRNAAASAPGSAPVEKNVAVSLRANATGERTEGGAPYYKAMTLKLDEARFVRLKALGLRRNQRSQTLLTEALDLLLSRYDA